MEGESEKFNKAAARFKESLTSINSRRRTVKILGPEFKEQLGKGKRMKVVPTTQLLQQHTTPKLAQPQQPITVPSQHTTTKRQPILAQPQLPIVQQQHTTPKLAQPQQPITVPSQHPTTTQQPILAQPQLPIVQQQHTSAHLLRQATLTSSNINIITQHNNNTNIPNKPTSTKTASFQYPVDSRGYTVTVNDEECLEDGRWLNDAIINVALSWIHKQVLSQEWSSTIRVLDSIWYDSATRNFPAGGTDALVENMNRMQKWFPAGHPFDGHMTIIPVCQQHHWFAVVTIEIFDGWLVTVMDSLDTQTSQRAQAGVAEILKLCWPQKQIGIISCTVPRQDNMNDCGLHLIRNVGRIAVWITSNRDSTWDALEEFLQRTSEPVSRATLKKTDELFENWSK